MRSYITGINSLVPKSCKRIYVTMIRVSVKVQKTSILNEICLMAKQFRKALMMHKRWIGFGMKKFSLIVQDMVQDKRYFAGAECDITSSNFDMSCNDIALKVIK